MICCLSADGITRVTGASTAITVITAERADHLTNNIEVQEFSCTSFIVYIIMYGCPRTAIQGFVDVWLFLQQPIDVIHDQL